MIAVAPARYVVDAARPADDAALRAVLRATPVPGAVALAYEREPSFFAADAVLGDRVETLAAREAATGAVIGLGYRALRRVWVDGEIRRIAYLGGLRVLPEHRDGRAYAAAWHAMRACHEADPVSLTLTSITAENERAHRLLVRRQRGAAPAFQRVADVVTLALPAWGWRRAPEPATLAEAVAAAGLHPDLFPADPRLADLPGDPVPLRVQQGETVATGVLWDAAPVRQSVVRAYGPGLRRVRPLLSAAARLAGAPPLPRVGERLRSGFLMLAWAEGVRAFRRLLDAALGAARARGLAFVLVGLDALDPRLAVARRRLHIAYRSTLYAADWGDGRTLSLTRPIYVEPATL